MEDDYRQPSPFPFGTGTAGFSDGMDDHVNDSIARIESLKLRVIDNPALPDEERYELLSDLNTLRGAFLHLCTQVTRAERAASGTSPAIADVNREDLELEGVIGNHPVILGNLDRIARIAPSRLTVLLEGETGSGKELFARIIHLNSRRKRFVPVNCGALPSGVIESELFGHVRGAFTGASTERKGRFEEADGGTIFLDEIGELEPMAQVKLLRALDVGEIQRVGSDKVIKVDVRVIAATNRNLETMVADGTFREDLFYRLSICHLFIPPLRERRDEIELLLDFFIRTYSAEHDMPEPELEPQLYSFLLDAYPFPGNIRELKNLAHYIVFAYGGHPVGIGDLNPRYQRVWQTMKADEPNQGKAARPQEAALVVRALPGSGRKAEMDRVENEQLVRSLERHHGHIPSVCADLNLSRARVYQILKKYGLRPDRFRTDV